MDSARHSLDFSASSPFPASAKYAVFRGAVWGFLGSHEVASICYIAMPGIDHSCLCDPFPRKAENCTKQELCSKLCFDLSVEGIVYQISTSQVAFASLTIWQHFYLKLILMHFCQFNLVLFLQKSLRLLSHWNLSNRCNIFWNWSTEMDRNTDLNLSALFWGMEGQWTVLILSWRSGLEASGGETWENKLLIITRESSDLQQGNGELIWPLRGTEGRQWDQACQIETILC